MGWVIAFGYKFIRFLAGELSFSGVAIAIAFAIYVALYLFSPATTGPRSLRGFMHYLFPVEIFRQARIDLFVFMIGKFTWAPLVAKLVAFLAFQTTALRLLDMICGERVLTAANSLLVLLTQFLVYYFASNFGFYWAHRAMHENRLLWSLHRAHHSAETLTFLTASRSHPLDTVWGALWTAFWSGAATAALSYSTGMAMHPLFPAVVFFWLILVDVADKFQHSHVRTTLGPLNYIMPSGTMHQIHHGSELKHRDKNYGNASSVFDWMFGTLYIPAPDEAIPLGLSEQERGARNPHRRPIDIYAEPLAHAWGVLRTKIAPRNQPGVPSTANDGGRMDEQRDGLYAMDGGYRQQR
ncbi:MAG: sterol desaturase family protein [Rhizomicrobium sp.]